MPSIEADELDQVAVLWEYESQTRKGETKVSSPVEVDVRWITGSRQVTNSQGRPISVDAQAVVDRDMTVGSILWLGSLADYHRDPADEQRLMEVASFRNVPDLKNREDRKSVGLTFYKGVAPEVA